MLRDVNDNRYFHVQTCIDGRWKDWTANPIQGEIEAKQHLFQVVEWAHSLGKSDADVRLRELSETEAKDWIVKEFREMFDRYLKAMRVDDLLKIVEFERSLEASS